MKVRDVNDGAVTIDATATLSNDGPRGVGGALWRGLYRAAYGPTAKPPACNARAATRLVEKLLADSPRLAAAIDLYLPCTAAPPTADDEARVRPAVAPAVVEVVGVYRLP